MASEEGVRECLRMVVRAGFVLPVAMNADPDATVATWMGVFERVSDPDLTIGTQAWLADDVRGYFPKPGQIRACVTSRTMGAEVVTDVRPVVHSPWMRLRQMSNETAHTQVCIDLLDQACHEAPKCDSFPGCRADDCPACSNAIMRRADELAQEVLNGPDVRAVTP